MKNYITIVFILFSFLGEAGIKIKGEFQNSSDKNKVYIYEYFIDHLILKDSAGLKKGKFQFKTDLTLGKYKIGFDQSESVDIILGAENLELTADAADFSKTFKIALSKENDQHKKFVEYQNALGKVTGEINMKLKRISAKAPDYNKKLNQLQGEFNTAKTARDDGFKEIIKTAPNTYAALNADFLLKRDSISEVEFFKEYDNGSLQRGYSLAIAMDTYLSRFLNGKPQAKVKKQIRDIPKLKETGSRNQEATYLAIISWVKSLDPKFAAVIAADYYRDFPKSPFQKKLKEELPRVPPTIGDMAPEIAFPNPDGEIMKLSSTKGKLVLLDFWASWCGPCRRENPNVVKTYEKYKDKGFTVFSVSLDKQASRWKGAITKDGLLWDTHVSDLKGWGSKAGRAYGVSSIPATFLIDQNGVIIAKNLRGHKLENKIKEILGE